MYGPGLVWSSVTEENLRAYYSASQDVNFSKIHNYSSLLAGENESGFSVNSTSEINLLIKQQVFRDDLFLIELNPNIIVKKSCVYASYADGKNCI